MKFFEAKNETTQLNLKETQVAIKWLKDHFEKSLASELNLIRVSAPLFVMKETGLNDDLNGVEGAVSFTSKEIGGKTIEIVHSLAKWKRQALFDYNFSVGEGLYTDMNAIRKDEELDNTHSMYVDQWDWELVISKADRQMDYLKQTVRKIYAVIKRTQDFIVDKYPQLPASLPDDITFITTQQLEDLYPDLSPLAREEAITKKHRAVFLIGIGGQLKSGKPHDGRSPDYDDWTLNGDILVWYDQLNMAFELSSMGIRVDEVALRAQLKEKNAADRLLLDYHRKVDTGELPYTIGGGIGQSRLCMFFLNKIHIGQVQASLWDDETKAICRERGIRLL